MSQDVIIRAWKDEDFWLSLSAEEQALVPKNPVGIINLNETDMAEGSAAAASCACTPQCTHTCPDCTTYCTYYSTKPCCC
jgi:mersacidin/lichenicidin family type 2 lantibiotic